MQKLVWQNANGETIDLTSGSYGITEWEGFSNASLNIQSQQVPFQDGAVFLDALIEPRELSVTLAMQDNNDLELRYQLRRELIHKLNPKLGEGYLIYTNDFISKRIKCVAQIPLFETHNSNDSGTPKASLSWVANEPYWEDLEETVVAISGLNTIQNEGDVSAQVEILIPTGASNPAIANRRNLKQIKLNGTYDGEVDINTGLGKKEINCKNINFAWVEGGTITSLVNKNGEIIYAGGVMLKENIMNGKINSFSTGYAQFINSIIYAKGLFVAVGQSRILITSPDGINWTNHNTVYGQEYTDVYFGNDLFVLVGNNGNILTSIDGINWTSRQSGLYDYYLYGTAYGNGLYVTVGSGGTILTSPDGITWTNRTSGVSVSLNSIIFNEIFNQFIAVGNNGTILTSPDGITWEQKTSGVSENLTKITYGNQFIAVGSNGTIITSPDGTNWTSRNSGVTRGLLNIKYINNQFIAVGNNGTILTSSDSINWIIKAEAAAENVITKITYGNQFIAVGSNGTIITSPDGTNWTSRNSGVDFQLNDCAYGNELYVIVGNSSKILTSPNGITWTQRNSGTNQYLNGIKYINNQFIAVGINGTILTSSNGTNWTSRTSGVTRGLIDCAYGNGLYVIVGGAGTVLTSPDSINWTQRTSGVDVGTSLRGVIFENNLFVAVGQHGTIITSPDGINWTSRNSDISENMYLMGITFFNNLFIVLSYESGIGGTVLTSIDGINWTIKPALSSDYLRGITHNIDLCVITTYDTIFNSYISETLNLISDLTPDSDMTFNLEVGNNDILYSDDNGSGATLKFRQKYIGV